MAVAAGLVEANATAYFVMNAGSRAKACPAQHQQYLQQQVDAAASTSNCVGGFHLERSGLQTTAPGWLQLVAAATKFEQW